MRYGFAIDQGTCIGCHACTVACKTEHQVPVGQFRTWVKYVEKGAFPATRREFSVMRCNHCTDAPCVRICPTQALFKRPDGIVDFDSDRCIGCKSCLQACPYDAIYIDADTHTAAKCNFCAHRVDQGMEPACVVVCPTHSIWVGDLDDPKSGISRLIAERPTTVRSPEQNTHPNVFYLGADRVALDPLEAPVADTYIYSTPDASRRAFAASQDQRPAEAARTTLNTAHARPWGWRVSGYLWTKSVAAGALMVAALALVANGMRGPEILLAAPALALFFSVVTGVLLLWDLKRPERFLYIFLKANPTSWLVWGTLAFTVYSGFCGIWLLMGVLSSLGVLGASGAGLAFGILRWVALPLAVVTAGYSALLFNQAEGRDLWQSPIFFWHLLDQALLAGSGALLLVGLLASQASREVRFLLVVLVVSAAVHLLLLTLEHVGHHPSRQAAVAAKLMILGPYAREFWLGAVAVPILVIALASGALPGAVAGLAALAGLLVQPGLIAYETAFVRAGQDVPLS
jgi:Fe-S-cluster-containing dehydrogenase component/formate-dependent nitrite reductase membrane component NrfD